MYSFINKYTCSWQPKMIIILVSNIIIRMVKIVIIFIVIFRPAIHITWLFQKYLIKL